MNLRGALEYLFWFGLLAAALLLAVGCGEVESARGAAGQGGRDGGAAAAAELDAGGQGGQGGQAGDLELATGGAGAGGQAGAGGRATSSPDAASCLDANAPGFSLGDTCDGGPPATVACHAACVLNGARFVGCVSGSPYAGACFASCGGC